QTHDDVVIGAGTVLDSTTARLAILNGAEYVVSPHFDPEIAKMCNRYSIPYLPGCGSVTEIVQAMETGVDLVKLFPGDLLGANFI
ncbi:2-dehydro-3-deoxyphosphogluconate aldolase, partial [Staphylococcus epidermidis]